MSAAIDEVTATSSTDTKEQLPVIWRTIIEVPLVNGPLRRNLRPMDEAITQLHDRAARLQTAERLLQAARNITGAHDWKVSITPRLVRIERFGEEFSKLSDHLRERGFTFDDFAVRVEYARAWGML